VIKGLFTKGLPVQAGRMMRQKDGENGKLREVSESIVRCFDAFYYAMQFGASLRQTGPE
jgi:hypothetical protein